MSKTPQDDGLSHFLRDPIGTTLDAFSPSHGAGHHPAHTATAAPKISKFTFLDPTNAHEFNIPTWLLFVKTEGQKVGLQRYVNDIQMDTRGGHTTVSVRDPALLREIAALREDKALTGKLFHDYISEHHAVVASYAGMNTVPDPRLAQDQRALMTLGFNIGTNHPDGIRGPFTDAALKEFAAQSHPPVPAAQLHNRLQIAAQQAQADADKYRKAGLSPITPAIAYSVRNAATATNQDYGMLMQMAQRESQFKPDQFAVEKKAYTDKHGKFHAAKYGHAEGLFQMEPSTWLVELRRHGEKYGLGRLASQVAGPDGDPTIKDPATLKYALGLRTDPRFHALLAAELQKENHDQAVAVSPTFKDSRAAIYTMHFLGGGSAGKTFLSGLLHHPDAPAANSMPQGVVEGANHSVFYSGGSALSFRQIFDSFEKSFAGRLFDSVVHPTSGNPKPGPK